MLKQKRYISFKRANGQNSQMIPQAFLQKGKILLNSKRKGHKVT